MQLELTIWHFYRIYYHLMLNITFRYLRFFPKGYFDVTVEHLLESCPSKDREL